jgi:hypothetical protein
MHFYEYARCDDFVPKGAENSEKKESAVSDCNEKSFTRISDLVYVHQIIGTSPGESADVTGIR